MKVVLTGAAGFLGWHTRLRLRALTDHEVVPVTRQSWAHLSEAITDADAVIHVAGVNPGDDPEVDQGNRALAEDGAAAVRGSGRPLLDDNPGVTRGEHFQLRKIERLAVIQGEARISLRKMFTDDVLGFHAAGDAPCAIDMTVGWVHNITNTGDGRLITQCWSHELHRPDAPDIYSELVRSQGGPS